MGIQTLRFENTYYGRPVESRSRRDEQQTVFLNFVLHRYHIDKNTTNLRLPVYKNISALVQKLAANFQISIQHRCVNNGTPKPNFQ